jgi:hypothetical protein
MNMTTMKKSFLTIAFLSVIAAVVLAGCSKNEPASPTPPASVPTNAPAPAK